MTSVYYVYADTVFTVLSSSLVIQGADPNDEVTLQYTVDGINWSDFDLPIVGVQQVIDIPQNLYLRCTDNVYVLNTSGLKVISGDYEVCSTLEVKGLGTSTIFGEDEDGNEIISDNGVFTVLADTPVKLTVQPANGMSFAGWGDGNTQNPRTVVVPAGNTVLETKLLPSVRMVPINITCIGCKFSVITSYGSYSSRSSSTIYAKYGEDLSFSVVADAGYSWPYGVVSITVSSDKLVLSALPD